jgi:5-(carboxyamino)imidazole ribonucleotide mutase
MSAPLVVVLMGSRSDEGHCRKIAEKALSLGLEVELRVGSAHKTPARVLAMLAGYESDPRPKVFIAVAGLSNALAGLVDGAVSAPVLTCPPPAASIGHAEVAGADIWSSVRMPPGIAPGYVADPGNAAILAAKILAPFDESVARALASLRRSWADRLASDDEALSGDGAKGGEGR